MLTDNCVYSYGMKCLQLLIVNSSAVTYFDYIKQHNMSLNVFGCLKDML